MARNPKKSKETKKEAPVVEAEAAVEEVKEGGLGFEDGIVLTTSLLLLCALALTWLASKSYAV